MSDYLTEGWPLGSTSTVYMNGNSVYHVRRYGKPGIVATVELRQEHADAVREVVEERVREAVAAELEAAAEMHDPADDKFLMGWRARNLLRDRAAAIRAGAG